MGDTCADDKTPVDLQLFIGERIYVAKRFVNTGTGMDVTAAENEESLTAELIRLKLGSWFLKKFYDDARLMDLDIDKGMLSYHSF